MQRAHRRAEPQKRSGACFSSRQKQSSWRANKIKFNMLSVLGTVLENAWTYKTLQQPSKLLIAKERKATFRLQETNTHK